MLNSALPSPHVIARRMPRCPSCNGRDYTYVSENTEDGFRLRDFSCEGCGADILELYHRTETSVPGGSHAGVHQFLLVVFGALVVFFILMDGLF